MEDASEAAERAVMEDSDRGAKFLKQSTKGRFFRHSWECSLSIWRAENNFACSASTYAWMVAGCPHPFVSPIHTRLFFKSRPQYPATPCVGAGCPCCIPRRQACYSHRSPRILLSAAPAYCSGLALVGVPLKPQGPENAWTRQDLLRQLQAPEADLKPPPVNLFFFGTVERKCVLRLVFSCTNQKAQTKANLEKSNSESVMRRAGNFAATSPELDSGVARG